ncbi:hypothetical protein SO802_006557 [Lithocarpus litseifolius]|uniref:Uncharacterized protein n=1 Tax=Lithocarpus litseifolius TaxID=425828 RepID=A0AAW2DMV7_9ROSI
MGFGLRILVSILVVFLLLQTLTATSSSSGRKPLARNKNRQIIPPNCTHRVSESQCSQTPQCRWCKSQSLDDTCFTRSEAWRLPLQEDTNLTVTTIQAIWFFFHRQRLSAGVC